MEIRRVWSWQRISLVIATSLIFHAVLVFYCWPLIGSSSSALSFVQNIDRPGSQTPASDNLSASAVCDSEYPGLYYEIDRAVALWKEKGHTISAADVDISWQPTGFLDGGALWILIHNNQVRILESRNAFKNPDFQERALGIVELLHRACEDATRGSEALPTIEAAIVLQDLSTPPTENGTHSFWTWTRPMHDVSIVVTDPETGVHADDSRLESPYERTWMIPNFDFWYANEIGSFAACRERAKLYDSADKIQKIVWRGTARINPVRMDLLSVTSGKAWADVRDAAYDTLTEDRLHITDLCKYAMTVHTEGWTYSGRLTHLLHCNSLVFIHDLQYTTHYYHLLQKDGPDQNYVAVRNDWSDLEEKVVHYLQHPEESQKIVDNHLAIFRNRYLLPEATSCYLQRLIHQYATVAFTPEVEEVKEDGTVGLRGRTFEEYMDYHKDFP